MSRLVAIVGESGVGKSNSILSSESLGTKGLDPKETFLINVNGQDLPVRQWKKHFKPFNSKKNPDGNLLETSNASVICSLMNYVSEKMPHIKNIVIDDFQYTAGFEFMDRSDEKGFDKFTDIAKHLYMIPKVASSLRDDITVFILAHSERVESETLGSTFKIKTVGKAVDNKITLEGLFTIILYAATTTDYDTGKAKYSFFTNRDNGTYPAKSPVGMFDTPEVPNDLGLVKDKIDEYYAE